jgi:hypothetical protein
MRNLDVKKLLLIPLSSAMPALALAEPRIYTVPTFQQNLVAPEGPLDSAFRAAAGFLSIDVQQR